MTLDETAQLLAYVASITGRSVNELSAAAWHDVIGDLAYDDAREAVRQYLRDSPGWLTPHNVVAGARQIANERADAAARRRRDDDTLSCGRRECPCTHTTPCVAGWLDTDETTRPCRVYRPEVAAILSGTPDTHDARMMAYKDLRARGRAKW